MIVSGENYLEEDDRDLRVVGCLNVQVTVSNIGVDCWELLVGIRGGFEGLTVSRH